MEKMTYAQLESTFREHNYENNVTSQFSDNNRLVGVIVFKQESWPGSRPYTLEERSYRVVSDNKAFIDGMCGNSVFGDCFDGIDEGVRLDILMREGGWIVDYCYID